MNWMIAPFVPFVWFVVNISSLRSCRLYGSWYKILQLFSIFEKASRTAAPYKGMKKKNKTSEAVKTSLRGETPFMYCGLTAELPADADILPPSNDRIFKVLLTHPDAEKVLIDIVSTVINRKVVAVQIRNIELPVMDVNEKDERLDINCTIDSGDQVDVEMHSCPQEEIGKEFFNFVNELVRTYQITFCMHTVLPDWPNFVNRFSLRNASGRLLSDQINMIIIELDKLDALLKKPVNKLTAFEKWSLFFKFAQDSIQRGKINDIIKEKEEIGMAAALLQQISRDEREKAIFRSRRMAETDRVSDLLTAEERGKIHEREKWQNVVAEKEAELADQKTMLAGQKTIIENLNMQIAELQAKVQNKSFS